MLRNFSLNWEESAPRLKRCIVNMGEASTLQEVGDMKLKRDVYDTKSGRHLVCILYNP